MKVAFCLAGLFKPSTTYSLAYQNKYHYLTEKIRKYKADCFIFSFSKEIEEEIVKIFNPVSYIIEHQNSFIDEISQYDDKETAKRVFSFFYSRKKVCELKRKQEQLNNSKYDIVVLCRPDLGYIYTENFELPDLNKIDTKYLYSIYWNQLNAGMADWFFVSSSENIDFISSIYDELPLFLCPNSEYRRSLKNGFPFSNVASRFSQELFSKNPQSSEIIDEKHMFNQHLLIKHFLVKNQKFSLQYLKFNNND